MMLKKHLINSLGKYMFSKNERIFRANIYGVALSRTERNKGKTVDMISKKGKRAIKYNEQIFYWYVKTDNIGNKKFIFYRKINKYS